MAPAPAPQAFGLADLPRPDRFVLDEPLQIIREFPRRGVARFGVLVDRFVHDRLKVPGQLPVTLPKPERFLIRHLLDQPTTILFVKRRAKCQHLVQGQTQRVHVATGVGLSLERFRRHVPQRAQDIARVRQVLLIVGLG